MEQAETRIKGIRDRIEHDQPLTAKEVRLLLAGDKDELLLDYYARSYARTGNYRAILKACAAWREAKRPEYGLRATGVLLDSLHRRGDGARSAVCRARGGTLLDLHELAEAKEWALRALACERESPDAHQLLGAILMEAGEVADGAWRFATARQLAGTQGAGRIEKNPAGGDKAAAAGA